MSFNRSAHRLLKDLKGKTLAHAFKMLKSEGVRIHVAGMDSERRPQPDPEKRQDRVNVLVQRGLVVHSWVG